MKKLLHLLLIPCAACTSLLSAVTPTLYLENSFGFFSELTTDTFATELPLFDRLSLQLGFELWESAGNGGFSSLAEEEDGDLYFATPEFQLGEYVLPTEDSAGYAVYLPGESSQVLFYRYDDWEEELYPLVWGETFWIRIDAENFADGTPQVTAMMRFNLVDADTEDPVATAFYDELMLWTNNTGLLFFEGEFRNNGLAGMEGTLTPVPEPATAGLFFSVGAVLGVAIIRRRRLRNG